MKILLLILLVVITSCNGNNPVREISIINTNGLANGNDLGNLVKINNIEFINMVRPVGLGYDTTIYELARRNCYFGPRIITIGNEWYHTRDLNPKIIINEKNLTIRNNSQAFNYGSGFNQKYVDNYWERDNHVLLKKTIPKVEGKQFNGEEFVLDREDIGDKKILLHFGFLACQGCQSELAELNKLEVKRRDLQIIYITPDSSEKLQRFLKVEEDRYVIQPPYNKFGKSYSKKLILDDGRIVEKFHIRGYPMNFLINRNGAIDSVGGLANIFINDLTE